MEVDPTRMCEKLVGLGDVDQVGIDDRGEGEPLVVVIRSRKPRPTCEACGGLVWSKGYRSCWRSPKVPRVDHRNSPPPCVVGESSCGVRSFIEQDATIGPERALLTSRAARWVTVQVRETGSVGR